MSDDDREMIQRLNIISTEHERDKYNTYSYILFALDAAFIGLAFVSPDLGGSAVFFAFAVVLFIWGWLMRRRARRI
jgi:Flp pilus assembly protein TadB